jgi:hypothetical protein
MCLVVGASDFAGSNDPRLAHPIDGEALESKIVGLLRDDLHPFIIADALGALPMGDGGLVALSEVMFLHSVEPLSSLFGVRVAQSVYESYDIFCALASIHPEYQSDGFVEVGKKISPFFLARRPQGVSQDQVYEFGLDHDFASWVQGAQFYFERAGFAVANDDLRLYLAWYWI